MTATLEQPAAWTVTLTAPRHRLLLASAAVAVFVVAWFGGATVSRLHSPDIRCQLQHGVYVDYLGHNSCMHPSKLTDLLLR